MFSECVPSLENTWANIHSLVFVGVSKNCYAYDPSCHEAFNTLLDWAEDHTSDITKFSELVILYASKDATAPHKQLAQNHFPVIIDIIGKQTENQTLIDGALKLFGNGFDVDKDTNAMEAFEIFAATGKLAMLFGLAMVEEVWPPTNYQHLPEVWERAMLIFQAMHLCGEKILAP